MPGIDCARCGTNTTGPKMVCQECWDLELAYDAEIHRLFELKEAALADSASKDAEIERLTEERWDNYQKWLNIIGQPLTPTQPEVPALIDHALRAYSELREQAIRACMWLNDDGSPCDGPRFREEQSKLRAMLGRDKWWRPEDADAEGGGE